jgi:hypothetical protein
LAAERAGAAHDQAPGAIGGLGDLCLAVGGVIGDRLPRDLGDRVDDLADLLTTRTPIEYSQPACSSRQNTLVDQNPESARSSFTPVAPARSTRAISSSQKRSIPFCVFADPFRNRMCNTSLVSARVARIG